MMMMMMMMMMIVISSIVAAAAVEDGGSYSSSLRRWSTLCDKVFECTEHSAVQNSWSAVPAVISRRFPTPRYKKIVTEHLLFRKLCARWVPKQLTPEHKAKRMESALTVVINLFLHLKKFLPGQRQRFQNDREVEMSVTQWFQSQAVDFYDTGIQKLIPRYDKCLSSGGEYAEK